MHALIDNAYLVEACREAIEWSVHLRPSRTDEEHLNYAFAAISTLLDDCPDTWLSAALDRASEQLTAL